MKKFYSPITDFIFAETPLTKVGAIFIVGGRQKELALKAVKLMDEGYASIVVITGGPNKRLKKYDTEAEYLESVLVENGIAKKFILLEKKSSNTMENAQYTKKLLRKADLVLDRVILVCKAFHARRALMSFQLVFGPEVKFSIAPVVDDRNITKENWHEDVKKIERVMEEVERIGKYFKTVSSEQRVVGSKQ